MKNENRISSDVLLDAASVCAIFASSSMDVSWDDALLAVCHEESMLDYRVISVMEEAQAFYFDSLDDSSRMPATDHDFRILWAEAEARIRCKIAR